MGIKLSSTIREASWTVARFGRLEIIQMPTGEVRFRVKVWDAGRDAFITRWFNDLHPADDFLERVRAENEAQIGAGEALSMEQASST